MGCNASFIEIYDGQVYLIPDSWKLPQSPRVLLFVVPLSPSSHWSEQFCRALIGRNFSTFYPPFLCNGVVAIARGPKQNRGTWGGGRLRGGRGPAQIREDAGPWEGEGGKGPRKRRSKKTQKGETRLLELQRSIQTDFSISETKRIQERFHYICYHPSLDLRKHQH